MREHAVWIRVVLFSLTFFFIRFADAMVSFWAPAQIEQALSSAAMVGVIVSMQSVVGFFSDAIFPHLLRASKSRALLFWAIVLAGLTSFALAEAAVKPWILLFLITMLGWGIYYELVSFATYQFMGNAVPQHMRSGAWGVADIFLNLAYFLGPLAAPLLLARGVPWIESAILLLLAAALGFLWLTNEYREPGKRVERQRVDPWEELRRWSVLSSVIWPAIVVSLLLGFIDATFWVTGVLWTQKLATQSSWGNWLLPMYQLPPLFIGFALAKWGVYRGKKILAEKFLIVAGIMLATVFFVKNIQALLAIVFVSSTALSLAYPLLEGVYTDIVARMGREKKDLIGLINSVGNIAYVIWPPLAGILTTLSGERLTFSLVGAMAALAAFVLLFVTPKKLRLPQQEIQTWDE